MESSTPPGERVNPSEPLAQGELFPMLREGKPRRRREARPPAEPPQPGLDEKIREVLERELGAPAPLEEHADLLPARMLNEFVYCPRLFFYEHVEGIFVDNADTLRGKGIHSRVDGGSGALAGPEAGVIHGRSVSLGSARLGVSAKLDLVEAEGGGSVCPVDYKAGAPRESDGGIDLWPADRMQLGLQMILLIDNGYACSRGIIYYRATKQRVPLDYSPELAAWVEEQVAAAREVVRRGIRPPPLAGSPKCVRCSLAPVCLPDETSHLAGGRPAEVRRLIAARDERRALYLNTQGLHVGLDDRLLVVREKGREPAEVRMSDIHHVALFGGVQITTQAVQQLCREEIPITYFSMGGWFYGITRGHALSNILVRKAQFAAAADPAFCLDTARRFVSGKIRNSRTLLMRNATEQPLPALARLACAAEEALEADSLATLLGIEGAAAACYFAELPRMLKPVDDLPGSDPSGQPFTFDFRQRNRRPPTDPVNALLSLAYSLLAKDCTVALLAVGFDPWLGFFHQLRPGRPALALDLMEEFRPLVAESVVLTLINTGMLSPADFVRAGDAVNLAESGRKRFFHAYEQRMGQSVTHPVFGYKVCYRRALELQARLLARALEGETGAYQPLLTR